MTSPLRTYYKPLVCCLLLLAACNKQEPEQAGTAEAISFSINGSQSRASIRYAESITSLGIFGYTTEADNFDPANALHIPDFFYNREAWRDAVEIGEEGAVWSYEAPLAYWPVDLATNNTFFAYSPHSSKFPAEANLLLSAETASGYPTLTYSTPWAVSDQVDVLYSDAMSPLTRDINRETNYGKVRYSMKHALAFVQFMIAPVKKENENANASYTITSFLCTGDNLLKRGRLNLGTGAWTGLEVSSAGFNFDVEPQPITVGTVSQIKTSSNNFMMLIPQTITAENNPIISISYTYDNGTGGEQDPDEYSFLAMFPNTFLHQGRILTYVVSVSTEGVSVKLEDDNSIEEWKQGAPVDVIDVY